MRHTVAPGSVAGPSAGFPPASGSACTVALLMMPFGPSDRPSLGISLLAQCLNDAGIAATSFYPNLDFERRVGPTIYRDFSFDLARIQIGEWLFSRFLDPVGEPEDYVAAMAHGRNGRMPASCSTTGWPKLSGCGHGWWGFPVAISSMWRALQWRNGSRLACLIRWSFSAEPIATIRWERKLSVASLSLMQWSVVLARWPFWNWCDAVWQANAASNCQAFIFVQRMARRKLCLPPQSLPNRNWTGCQCLRSMISSWRGTKIQMHRIKLWNVLPFLLRLRGDAGGARSIIVFFVRRMPIACGTGRSRRIGSMRNSHGCWNVIRVVASVPLTRFWTCGCWRA